MSTEDKRKYELPSETAKTIESIRTQPQQIKIKHSFEGCDLKLDGYVYYAQKMR